MMTDRCLSELLDALDDLARRLFRNGPAALGAVGRPPRAKSTRRSHRFGDVPTVERGFELKGFLVDGDGRREAGDFVDVRACLGVPKLARVAGDVTPCNALALA